VAQPSKPKQPKTSGSAGAKAKPKAKAALDKAAVEEAIVVEETPKKATESAKDAKAEALDGPESTAKDEIEESLTQKPATDTDPIPAEAPAPVLVEQRARVMPLIFGGVIAAVLGAGALYLAQSNGWLKIGNDNGEVITKLDAQAAEISELKAALASLSGDVDAVQAGLSPMQDSVASVSGTLTTVTDQIAGLAGRIDATDARVAGIEMQPIPKAELPAEVVTAYEAQMASMLATVDGRFEGMQTILDSKLAEITAAQAAASATEESALRAANLAEAKAAMSQVSAALDNGGSFADPLAVIAAKGGVEIPASLSAVADGVPTLDNLKAGFPDAARAALAASNRDAAADGSVSPVTAFFRTQLGARSLEPREGSDPDAVLSRAEAAVGAGDLALAMTEIGALPQVGQDALADWIALAEIRKTAISDAAALAAKIQTN